ncbi:MAG: hypothetical protein K2N24_08285 [Lachnospiraceae bacterium]|nr:hypothetical protein [Lachnospiraceae bacterium]
MAISSVGNYGAMYENAYASQKKETGVSRQGRSGETAVTGKNSQTGTEESTKTQSTQEYLKGLQKKVPYVELETGWGLSMKRDKRSAITVNPKLLEKMQNDPEAEKKYTQTLKDIERAEKIGDAYYNALGGVVERTSHWYVDENGKYYHFAYTRRDDKLNKKIREEAKKNTEELIEKTREKAREKRKELEERLAEKSEEAKDIVAERMEQMLTEKLEASENGEIYLDEKDMEPVMEAIREEENASSAGTGRNESGTKVDLKV